MVKSIKSKLVFKDLGEPSLIKALPEDKLEMLLGTIVGMATDIVLKKGPDGVSTFTGLKGTFEGVPADQTKDTTASGITFLGDAFQSEIVAALETGDVDSVNFAFEVWVVRAKNPQGYSWKLVPLMKPAESDPLSELRKLLKAPEEQAKLAAPAKADKK